MSLITQCPACSTMFRVVPDQLRISEGWVRCGHCDEVFDANAHLGTLEESAEQTHSVAAQAAVAATDAVPQQQPKAQDDYDYDLGAAWDNPALVDPGPVELALPEPHLYVGGQSLEMPVPSDASEPQGVEPVADLHAFEPPAEVASHHEAFAATEMHAMADTTDATDTQAFAPAPAPDEVPVAPAVSAEVAAESVSPSFMRSAADTKKRWIGNGMAAALGTLLLLALVVQVARQERDRLAAVAPALRPALVAGCEWLACSVAPLREIESIAIDSSAFTSVRPGVYLLSVTLKNTAAMDLAMPALELTLTDMQDEPVVRRVLLAPDWSGKPLAEPMVAGAERTAKLPISVPPDAVPHKIAGYKLLAFYP